MSDNTTGAGPTAGTSQTEGVTYYIEKNRFFSMLVGRRKYSVLRFALIFGAWYPIIWAVCWFDDALGASQSADSRSAQGSSQSDGTPKAYTAVLQIGLYGDVYFPAMFPAFVWMAIALRRLLRCVDQFLASFPRMLRPANGNGDDEPALQQSLQRLRDTIALRAPHAKTLYWSIWGVWMAVAFSFTFVVIARGDTNGAWPFLPRRHPYCFAVNVPWTVFCNSIAASITWYVLAIGFTVFPLVKRYAAADRLCIVPNAPDGQGGLAPIGAVAFAMISSLGGGMILVVVGICAAKENIPVIVAGVAYSAFVSVVFFWPLLSAHDAMQRSKRAELERVALLFRREYELLPATAALAGPAAQSVNDVELTSRLEMMARLEHLHAAVSAMPVWPFDTRSLRKYLLFVLAPLLSALFTAGAERFKLWSDTGKPRSPAQTRGSAKSDEASEPPSRR